MKSMSDKELYEFAKKKVESRRGLIVHLGIYFTFSSISIILLLVNGFKPEYVVPVLGWGIGIIFHALSLNFNFGFNTQSQIQKEIDKLKRN